MHGHVTEDSDVIFFYYCFRIVFIHVLLVYSVLIVFRADIAELGGLQRYCANGYSVFASSGQPDIMWSMVSWDLLRRR